MSSVEDSTKEIKNNLQSFDVIHAIEEQVNIAANIPEDLLNPEETDYSTWLDRLIEEASKIDTSITSAALPKLDDLSIGIGDIAYTIKNDIGGFFGTLQKTADKISESFSELLRKLGIILPETKTKEETTNDLVGALVDLKTGGFSWQGIKNLATAANEYIKKTPGGTTVAGGVGLITGYTRRLLTGDPMSKWVLSRTHETSIGNAPAQPIQISIEEAIKDTPEFITREIRINGNRVQIP